MQQIQNFSSISPKLCQIGQKNTGTWGVNTTIVDGRYSSRPLFIICIKIPNVLFSLKEHWLNIFYQLKHVKLFFFSLT